MRATLGKSLSNSILSSNNEGLNLLFYDANLEGGEHLIPYINDGSKIVSINSTDNFFTKLNNYSSVKINKLTILCHGKPGELVIGEEIVNKNSLLKFAQNNTSLNIEFSSSPRALSCCA